MVSELFFYCVTVQTKNTIAHHYSIQKWASSKERVGSREDATSSNQTTQQIDGMILSKANVDKEHTSKDKT